MTKFLRDIVDMLARWVLYFFAMKSLNFDFCKKNTTQTYLMKITSRILSATVLPALAVSTALAGEAPVTEPVVVEEATSMFSSKLGVNYASTYEFRGVDFGDHLVDATLATDIALAEDLSLSVGAWYASLVQDDYTELNLYTSLNKTFGDFTVGVGYTWYYFGSADVDANEVNLTASYAITDSLKLNGGAFYDFETEGYYFVTAATYAQELAGPVSLEATAGIAYNIDYYVDGDGFNNAFVQLAFPIALTETATFTPYVRGSLAMDVLEDAGQDDLVIGGASLTVTF